ncbi:hypothetical protein WN55_07899 [Dufourea novaeangliae]|uniref:Uncharacterized protein n=1 Tax=Dufourea novaeangliae TaxID=178035 RepID=A0A154NY56_DUFNO|nr:hypothetical protein WN55_07899 [Dufourea novaeangliae]
MCVREASAAKERLCNALAAACCRPYGGGTFISAVVIGGGVYALCTSRLRIYQPRFAASTVAMRDTSAGIALSGTSRCYPRPPSRQEFLNSSAMDSRAVRFGTVTPVLREFV